MLIALLLIATTVILAQIKRFRNVAETIADAKGQTAQPVETIRR